MQQAESLSLDEIESFLDGCGSVEFQAGSRADKYALVEGVLKRHHYADQKRSVKGLLRRFLSKLTGLSRAQLTRLIGQFLREKCVRPTAYRRRRFPTKYQPRRHRSPGACRPSTSTSLRAGDASHSPARVPNLQPQGVRTPCRTVGGTPLQLAQTRRLPATQFASRQDSTDTRGDRRTPPTRAARTSGLPAHRHRALARTGR